MTIPNEAPWVVEIEDIKFAVPEAVCLLLKAVSEERDSLLAVARAAAWFVEVTPEKDLYYALNKYCVEAVDDMIAALAAVEDLL